MAWTPGTRWLRGRQSATDSTVLVVVPSVYITGAWGLGLHHEPVFAAVPLLHLQEYDDDKEYSGDEGYSGEESYSGDRK